MLLKKFVDRKEELQYLKEKYDSPNPEFIILYGRRRIGKTELIKQFIKDKPSFYFIAKKQRLNLELRRFIESFSRKFKTWIEPTDDWEIAFERVISFIEEKQISEKFVIVIDEFPYWIEENEQILYTFQVIWDEILSKHNVMLILLGSTVSTMTSAVLNYKSPLYGRRTGQWMLEPLRFYHLSEFYPRYSVEDIIKVYGCTGGIPYYLIHFDDELPFMENLKNLFFTKGGVLFEEGEILLREELREVYVYLDILRAISEGHTKRSEIANYAGVDITNITKYIATLEKLGIISKIYPVIGVPRKRKYVQLRISDYFFSFWLRFVYPYREDISLDIYDFSHFQKMFSDYMGIVFEEISKQALIKMLKNRELPFIFSKIGKWWYKDIEIDLVAFNEARKVIAFVESKWTANVDGKRVITNLKKKSAYVKVPWVPEKIYYIVFAKSFLKKTSEPNVLFFDKTSLERLLQ